MMCFTVPPKLAANCDERFQLWSFAGPPENRGEVCTRSTRRSWPRSCPWPRQLPPTFRLSCQSSWVTRHSWPQPVLPSIPPRPQISISMQRLPRWPVFIRWPPPQRSHSAGHSVGVEDPFFRPPVLDHPHRRRCLRRPPPPPPLLQCCRTVAVPATTTPAAVATAPSPTIVAVVVVQVDPPPPPPIAITVIYRL